MPKSHQSTRDMRGTPIAVGSRVWVTPFARLYKAHPEFRREFRKVAGQTRTVVGFDVTGGVWLGLGRHQVITVDGSLLKVLGMANAPARPTALRTTFVVEMRNSPHGFSRPEAALRRRPLSCQQNSEFIRDTAST